MMEKVENTTPPRKRRKILPYLLIFLIILGAVFSYPYLNKTYISLQNSKIALSELPDLKTRLNEVEQALKIQKNLNTTLLNDFNAIKERTTKTNIDLALENKIILSESLSLIIQATTRLSQGDSQTSLTFLKTAAVYLSKIKDPNLAKTQENLNLFIDNLEKNQDKQNKSLALLNQSQQLIKQTPLRSWLGVDQAIVPNEEHKTPWQQSLMVLKKFITIRHESVFDPALLDPSTKLWIFQNFDCLFDQAHTAVISHNPKLFTLSLSQIKKGIHTYFQANATETKTLINHLNTLNQENVFFDLEPLEKIKISILMQLEKKENDKVEL